VAILGISGSLRRGSNNTKVLCTVGKLLEAEGLDFELYEGLKQVPPYDEDDDRDPVPAAAADLRRAVAEADGLFFSTPEYNHSIPGQLKNAVDWLSRPIATNVMRNKPVAVVGASTGMFGAVWAQAELRKVLAATGARVAEGEVPIAHAHTLFDEDGTLTDPNLLEQLRAVAQALVDEIATSDRASGRLAA
jgi:chromate reductase